MELDSDLNLQRNNLEKSIRIYRNWAIFFAALTAIPFVVAAIYKFTNPSYLSLEETGSYIGGFSAPFASLSGILFVYVAFLGQRLQIIYQQQDLRTNQKELQETRNEIRGQKEQLELQNKQFERQAFENTFFKLFDLYDGIREKTLKKIRQPAYSDTFNEGLEMYSKYENTQDGMFPREQTLNLSKISFGTAKGIYIEQFRSDLGTHRYLVQYLMPVLLTLDDLKIKDLKERYIDILIKTLGYPEKFIIGYTALFNSVSFSSHEIKVLNEFSQRFNRMIFIRDHYKWLSDEYR